MNVNGLEWDILAKFQSHHNHAGYPEENNIITSNQGAGWVELLQLRSFLWPTHSFKWPQARAEPGIQYILILMEMLAATFWTYIYISTRNSGFATIITVPGRNPMAPPQLAGNTPITNIVQPVAIDFGKSLWYEFDFASLDSLYSRLSQGIHLDKPLGRNHWLNGGMATGAMTNSMLMILNRYQNTNLFKFLHQSFAALIAIHTLIFASTLSHFTSVGNNLYLLQIVTESHFIVVRIMGWSNLYGTSTKGRINIFISKERNLSVHYWQNQRFANQLSITLIRRIYSYAGITKHGFRTGSSYLNVFVLALNLIANMPQMTGLSFMLHLNIRNSGVAIWAPVGNAGSLINQALFIKADKNLTDSLGTALVHSKTLSIPIQRGTQGTKLAHNTAAKLFLPIPNSLQELLSAQFIAIGAFCPQSTLYLGLSSYTSMVTTRHPQGIVALHTAPANQNILQSVVQCMAHMELASYIWRWDNNAIWFLFFLYNSMKQLVFLPEAIPFLFKAFGVINLGDIILFHVLKLLYFKSKKLSRPARAKEHIFRGTT